ncbi:testis-specific serine kinase substrate isoform X8 [Bos indicus]|uniref:Testis-specific serine kinase substrate isoform X8 n=1 Tax=Bos indicus TaxID=9915 RepID=A0ABM4QWD6_BOSIN
MASVVVKTIWQSKEIHEAGDPPAGVESRSQLVPETPGGVTSPVKGIAKKKKAVSFHGVEPRMSHEPMHWCLNLKRSSACTNVSLLNLAAMEPTDSSGTDSTTEDSSSLALPVPPASPTPPWAPDDPDITEILKKSLPPGLMEQEHRESKTRSPGPQFHQPFQGRIKSGVNSGLVRAKDSITSLKEKTTRVNQHVQTLQSECSVLSENLEKRRQEAEELEGYCSQLKENCRKVTRSVEDAEIKTNVLKQNSALLEEKLRYLQQQLQDETPRRQEAELQELEQKLEAGLSRHGLGPATQPPGCSGPPGSPDEPPRPRGLAPGGWGMGPRAGEGPIVSEQELQKVSAGLEELRVERSAVSVASLRSELEGLGPVKPILEELGRQFQSSRRVSDLSMNLDRGAQGSCTRCASQGQQLSTESLQQLLERALTPLVDEVKQRGLAPACPSCQRLHKKILVPRTMGHRGPVCDQGRGRGAPGTRILLELERQALAKHVRAEALSSTLRLAQDEALRAKNLLLTDKMKPEEKVAALDYLHLKMCSLHDQLSNLPLEGSTGTMGGGSGGGTPPKRGGPTPEQ